MGRYTEFKHYIDNGADTQYTSITINSDTKKAKSIFTKMKLLKTDIHGYRKHLEDLYISLSNLKLTPELKKRLMSIYADIQFINKITMGL